ncbi:MAG: S8 family peptidase [Lachnospiraceae bacterium]|nr:S8 family peptidase [Lachnospiraceae bacterium]
MEYYKRIHAESVWRQGRTGRGTGIALLDTGCAAHPDLEGRVKGFMDFVHPFSSSACYDDNGHGTHIAGILAGNGRMSGGRYRGMAPGADLTVLKVLDRQGGGRIADLVQALRWLSLHAGQYGIRIVNISVGGTGQENEAENALLLTEVERLWDQGLVVVAAAGNNGPAPGSVTTPGVSCRIITVGCSQAESSDSFHEVERAARFSGRGPAKGCAVKPEILAPGLDVVSCCPQSGRRRSWYTAKSGTSMAVPMVSGAIALLLEKYPAYSNVDVKRKLQESSMPLAGDGQGWGELRVDRLLE